MTYVAQGWAVPSFRGAPMWGGAERSPGIELAGLRLATDLADVEAGAAARIVASDLVGWDDDVPDETTSDGHPSGDGTVSGPLERGARRLVIPGYVFGDSIAAAHRAKAQLRRARSGRLVVEDRALGLTLEASVRRVGLVWDRVTDHAHEFTLSLKADDPLRYSTATLPMANGALTLPNRGDEAASPLLELSGPHGAITVVHPGGTWRLTAVAAGVTRVHDVRNGDVWQGGVRVFGTESGAAPSVAAGGSAWTVSGLGSGSARVRRFEAFS